MFALSFLFEWQKSTKSPTRVGGRIFFLRSNTSTSFGDAKELPPFLYMPERSGLARLLKAMPIRKSKPGKASARILSARIRIRSKRYTPIAKFSSVSEQSMKALWEQPSTRPLLFGFNQACIRSDHRNPGYWRSRQEATTYRATETFSDTFVMRSSMF